MPTPHLASLDIGVWLAFGYAPKMSLERRLGPLMKWQHLSGADNGLTPSMQACGWLSASRESWTACHEHLASDFSFPHH